MSGSEIDAELKKCNEELANVKGTECEVYTRIVGYYRPVKNWNPGKKDEYGKRKLFDGWDYQHDFKEIKRRDYESRPVNPECPWR